MNNISILDCTLRDGGYVNNWNFGENIVSKVIKRLTQAHIDIIECGFIMDTEYDKNLSLFSNTHDVNDVYNIENSKSMYVGMIALGEKEIHYSKIEKRRSNSLDGIRITFHGHEVDKAIEFALDLMGKGYEIFMQPVGTMFYTDAELLTLIEKMNRLSPFAFYIVDTLGSMSSSDVLRLFYLIDNNLASNINIGFHSHNNLQLAFSNAKELVNLQTNRNIIIDSSVFGMGRGAGNLCTELIAEHINSTIEYKYDCVKLFSIIDTCLMPIKEKFDWGYSAAYYIAAIKQCHPSYATYLISKGTLRSADIDNILTMIPKNKSYLYNKDLINDLYIKYQENIMDDSIAIEELKNVFNGKEILLIAPGGSILSSVDVINNIKNKDNILTVSVNFSQVYDVNYVFISNKKRYEDLVNIHEEKLIFTSNVETNNDKALVVNYTSLLNKNEYTYDSAGLMAIELMIKLGATHIYLAGFDGFAESNNHYDGTKKTFSKQNHIDEINKEMQESLNFYTKKIDVEFVTPSVYNI
ncbi:MAG: aldolase catalytic domain-containing protein [Bacillota bacterium]